MDAAEYAEQQEEELEALTFIYTDEMEVVSDKPPIHLVFSVRTAPPWKLHCCKGR